MIGISELLVGVTITKVDRDKSGTQYRLWAGERVVGYINRGHVFDSFGMYLTDDFEDGAKPTRPARKHNRRDVPQGDAS